MCSFLNLRRLCDVAAHRTVGMTERCYWCLKARVREGVAGSRPEEEEEGKVAQCHHGNIYPARRTSSASPAHMLAGKQGPREVWLQRIVDVWRLGCARLELGVCLLLRMMRCVPGAACLVGSGKEDVLWGLSILSYYSPICF